MTTNTTTSFDPTLPHCTYITRHPSGCWYAGKGATKLVLAGKYKGSGIRLKLAWYHPDFPFESWTTEVLKTFHTSDAAYAEEEKLVTFESLHDPFCLNMKPGGKSQRWKVTVGTLLKQKENKLKRERKAKATAKARIKKAEELSKKREQKRLEIAERQAARAARGGKHSAETIAKMAAKRAEYHKNNPKTPEERLKIGKRLTAAKKPLTPEQRAKLASSIKKSWDARRNTK